MTDFRDTPHASRLLGRIKLYLCQAIQVLDVLSQIVDALGGVDDFRVVVASCRSISLHHGGGDIGIAGLGVLEIGVPEGVARRRVDRFRRVLDLVKLLEMGLTTGKVVEVLYRAPLGDPIAIDIDGYVLSLRKDEADLIEVSTLENIIAE